METKSCIKCNQSKEIDQFVKDRNTCKQCKNARERDRLADPDMKEKERLRAKEKYQKNKEKHCQITKRYYEENLEWRKDLHLRKTYGITMDDKLDMRTKQNNKCCICKIEFENDKSAYVDHCHTTGKVRGLLCHKCNSGLGYFYDNVEYLQNAISYLRKE